MNIITELIGATVGLIMRVFDYVSGRRKYWKDEMRDESVKKGAR